MGKKQLKSTILELFLLTESTETIEFIHWEKLLNFGKIAGSRVF